MEPIIKQKSVPNNETYIRLIIVMSDLPKSSLLSFHFRIRFPIIEITIAENNAIINYLLLLTLRLNQVMKFDLGNVTIYLFQ